MLAVALNWVNKTLNTLDTTLESFNNTKHDLLSLERIYELIDVNNYRELKPG